MPVPLLSLLVQRRSIPSESDTALARARNSAKLRQLDAAGRAAQAAANAINSGTRSGIPSPVYLD